MSEDVGFLLDAESLDAIQRHLNSVGLSEHNIPSNQIANPSIPIYVFVIDEQDPATGGFRQTYNGYQSVFDSAVGGWVYKKGGLIFGNSFDTQDTEEFDGPRVAALTVFVMGTDDAPSLVIETNYAAYPTYTTGVDVDSELIYVIDTAWGVEVIPGCHLSFDPEQEEERILNVSVLTLLGGVANMPLEPIQSEFLTFLDGPDNDGTFPCLFLDINCETFPPALAGWGFKIQDPPIIDEPCKLMIELDDDCDVLEVDEFGLFFNVDPLLGLGLSNTFDCEIDILLPALSGLEVDVTGLFLDIMDLTSDTPSIVLDYIAHGNIEGVLNEKATFEEFLQAIPFWDAVDKIGLTAEADQVAWREYNEGITLGADTIDVDYKNSIEVDGADPDAQLQLVGDTLNPGVFHWYGTASNGLQAGKGWNDLADLAGSGISFDTNYDLDIMELATGTPDVTLDFFSFGTTLGVDNEKANLNSMMDAVLTTITVITDIELDGSNNLRIKTTEIDAYDLQTESVFATVTGWTTSDCP